MKKGLTELVFIIDRSGSMSGMEADTVGGFNSMLQRQKEMEGEALVTTVLFSNNSSTLHDRLPIADVEPLTREDYRAYGCTALYDAIGESIEKISTVHRYAREEDIPEHTLFVITTDGMENASQRYDSGRIKELIKQQEAKGWEFLFVAANIDVASAAEHIGIRRDRAASYRQTSEGTRGVYEAVDYVMCSMRMDCDIPEDWAKAVETPPEDADR